MAQSLTLKRSLLQPHRLNLNVLLLLAASEFIWQKERRSNNDLTEGSESGSWVVTFPLLPVGVSSVHTHSAKTCVLG